MGLVWVKSALFSADRTGEFVGLAWEAGYGGRRAAFLYAAGHAGDLRQCDGASLTAMAVYYDTFGKKEGALELLRAGLLRYPDDPDVLMALGHHLAREGQVRRGIEFLQRGLELRPADAVGLGWLGSAFATLGETERARGCFETILRCSSKEQADAALASLAEVKGDWEAVSDFARRALKQCPSDAGEWYNLGNSLCRTGKYREALRAFRKSIRLGFAPDHEAFYGMAVCHLELGNLQKARKSCEEVLKRRPADAATRQLQDLIEQDSQ